MTDRSVGIGRYGGCQNAVAPAFKQGVDHIGCCAGCCDAYDCVVGVDVEFLKIFPALELVVLGILDRVAESRVATSDNAYHPTRIHAEGRRYLGCVEHTDATRGAGTHVEDASAAFHAGDNFVDKLFDPGYGASYGFGDFVVFGVDVAQDLAYRFLFEVVVKRRLFADLDECHCG